MGGPDSMRWVRLFFARTYMDRQRRAGLLFILPALLYFCLVFVVPLGESVVGSFYRTVPGAVSYTHLTLPTICSV